MSKWGFCSRGGEKSGEWSIKKTKCTGKKAVRKDELFQIDKVF